mmetsp:Transcript_5716/g.11354  ORF Transcript_5716/g.11354 Transcript_5716/m.11354 type:complete len:314 (+) Transcript_5716:133-1074(+)
MRKTLLELTCVWFRDAMIHLNRSSSSSLSAPKRRDVGAKEACARRASLLPLRLVATGRMLMVGTGRGAGGPMGSMRLCVVLVLVLLLLLVLLPPPSVVDLVRVLIERSCGVVNLPVVVPSQGAVGVVVVLGVARSFFPARIDCSSAGGLALALALALVAPTAASHSLRVSWSFSSLWYVSVHSSVHVWVISPQRMLMTNSSDSSSLMRLRCSLATITWRSHSCCMALVSSKSSSSSLSMSCLPMRMDASSLMRKSALRFSSSLTTESSAERIFSLRLLRLPPTSWKRPFPSTFTVKSLRSRNSTSSGILPRRG